MSKCKVSKNRVFNVSENMFLESVTTQVENQTEQIKTLKIKTEIKAHRRTGVLTGRIGRHTDEQAPDKNHRQTH